MYSLPTRNKKTLVKKIRRHKRLCFPGKGGNTRLAEEVGVSPQTVSKWLNGTRTPTIEQLYLLARAFNVSPLELCGIPTMDKPPRNTADISLLKSLLDVLEQAMKHDASPSGSVKTMKLINDILIKGMEEIDSKGNDVLM